MGKRVALVALGRSSLPTGETVLTGELAEGVTLAALARSLTKGDLEFEQLAPLPAPRKPVAPAPFQTAVAPKPAPAPIAKSSGWQSGGQTTEGPRPAAPAAAPKPRPVAAKPDRLAGKSAAEVRSELEQARKLDEAARDMAKKHTKAELIKAAKKIGASFSARGTNVEIAQEILEHQAKR